MSQSPLSLPGVMEPAAASRSDVTRPAAAQAEQGTERFEDHMDRAKLSEGSKAADKATKSERPTSRDSHENTVTPGTTAPAHEGVPAREVVAVAQVPRTIDDTALPAVVPQPMGPQLPVEVMWDALQETVQTPLWKPILPEDMTVALEVGALPPQAMAAVGLVTAAAEQVSQELESILFPTDIKRESAPPSPRPFGDRLPEAPTVQPFAVAAKGDGWAGGGTDSGTGYGTGSGKQEAIPMQLQPMVVSQRTTEAVSFHLTAEGPSLKGEGEGSLLSALQPNKGTPQEPTSAAPRTLTPASPQFADDLAEEVGRMRLISRPGGNEEVRLRLHPRELGQLNLQMRVDDDNRVHINIIAESENAKDLLQKQVSQLRDALGRANLECGEFSVDVDDSGSRSHQQGHPREGGHPSGRGREYLLHPDPGIPVHHRFFPGGGGAGVNIIV